MIHGKLQIFFQMFSQISRTPDFERSFRLKRCGLYAGVYGILHSLKIQPQVVPSLCSVLPVIIESLHLIVIYLATYTSYDQPCFPHTHSTTIFFCSTETKTQQMKTTKLKILTIFYITPPSESSFSRQLPFCKLLFS